MFELPGRNAPGYFFVFQNQLSEVEAFSPRMHGVILDHSIRIFPRNPVLNEIEKKLAAEDQTFGAFEINLHSFWIDEHRVQQLGRFLQHVINQCGGVRNYDALH